ncbi:MAG: succinate dehydrogenase [Alphaproteobacteria bacterium]|nr:succinate dehydrogenase [Alphaproteobacteria bacterium]
MSARTETWLWLAQRMAAIVLALAVALHLATIIYAAHRGLSAAAILARTQGNTLWLAFYLVFAAMAALHGGIGLRTVLRETTLWRGRSLDLATAAIIIVLTAAGWRAAAALFA